MAKEAIIAVGVKPKSDSPEFMLPDGVDMADVKKGGEKEVTAVIRNYGGGKVCLVSINGVPINSDEDDESTESDDDNEPPTPDNSQASYNMAGGMGGAASAAGLM